MPTISYFYGIAIRMYFFDHPPPHFSAEYQGHEANISIDTGEVIAGKLPRTAARIVKEWAAEHRAELIANWHLVESGELPVKIPGADE